VTSRIGLLGVSFLARSGGPGPEKEELEPDRLLRVQDFKMGEAEKVGGRDAKVLHYRLDIEGKDSFTITLWLDARTLLPLKRVVAPEKEREGRITETYTEFTLNPQLDAKTFELPK
jgi:outer membrane lipoprotein-sorting protein